MRITFNGACREVTGSNILVEAAGKKILLDVGFFQGSKLAEDRNFAPFAYDAYSIDFAVVCHAHLDHTGRLPKLVKDGFRGRIFSTAPTKELTRLVLEDSEKLMRDEAEKDNHQVLFSKAEIEQTMQLFETLAYGEELEIAEGVKLMLKNAGHILGSAVISLRADGKTLVYSSDLGNQPSVLLSPPDVFENADIAICESTYGGRIHEDSALRHEKLNEIIKRTISQNAVLMIPSFAIERTQELLHDIDHFCTTNNCAFPTFFLDSPLAERVTKVFEKYPEFLSPKITNGRSVEEIFGLERIKITSTVDESIAIEEASAPKIIIAGSGMMNGGRILYHLQDYISDPNNTLLVVGYQARGTLGRRILDGEKEIKIHGKIYQVHAKVLAIGSYSAHADSVQLVDWVSKIKGLQKVFLVHGEADQSVALGKSIEAKLKLETVVPQQGESYELT